MNIKWIEKDGAFWLLDEREGQYTNYLCQAVRVNGTLVDLFSKEQSFLVEFESAGEIVEKHISKANYEYKNLLRELMVQGLDINDCEISCLKQILIELGRSAPVLKKYSKLGYPAIGQGHVFMLDEMLEENECYYLGGKKVAAAGDPASWYEMIEQEVLGNPALEMALAVGFSAPVLAKVDAFANVDNLLVSLLGRTSTGKTTALMLTASIWGKPDQTQEGIISNFNATPTVLQSRLANMIGFPAFIDESASVGAKDWSRVIYDIAAGTDKERATTNLQVRERRNWLTTTIITSERSMLEYVENEGVKVRLIELPFRFFQSAESADFVKKTVRQSYAHAGREFISYLLKVQCEDLENRYSQAVAELHAQFTTVDEVGCRQIRKLAVFLLTAKLVNDANIGIPLACDKIVPLLVEIVNDAQSRRRDISEEAFEFLKNKIAENENRLIIGYGKAYLDDIVVPSRVIGKAFASSDKKIHRLWLLRSYVNEVLEEGRYMNQSQYIFAKWEEAGYLIQTDKKRHDTKRTIGNFKNVRVQVLDLKDPLEGAMIYYDAEDENKSLKKQKLVDDELKPLSAEQISRALEQESFD